MLVGELAQVPHYPGKMTSPGGYLHRACGALVTLESQVGSTYSRVRARGCLRWQCHGGRGKIDTRQTCSTRTCGDVHFHFIFPFFSSAGGENKQCFSSLPVSRDNTAVLSLSDMNGRLQRRPLFVLRTKQVGVRDTIVESKGMRHERTMVLYPCVWVVMLLEDG